MHIFVIFMVKNGLKYEMFMLHLYAFITHTVLLNIYIQISNYHNYYAFFSYYWQIIYKRIT